MSAMSRPPARPVSASSRRRRRPRRWAIFRGLINGRPFDLDKHMGGRCLRFIRDGGIGEYRVYVMADLGEDLIVTRTVKAPADPAGGLEGRTRDPL